MIPMGRIQNWAGEVLDRVSNVPLIGPLLGWLMSMVWLLTIGWIQLMMGFLLLFLPLIRARAHFIGYGGIGLQAQREAHVPLWEIHFNQACSVFYRALYLMSDGFYCILIVVQMRYMEVAWSNS